MTITANITTLRLHHKIIISLHMYVDVVSNLDGIKSVGYSCFCNVQTFYHYRSKD